MTARNVTVRIYVLLPSVVAGNQSVQVLVKIVLARGEVRSRLQNQSPVHALVLRGNARGTVVVSIVGRVKQLMVKPTRHVEVAEAVMYVTGQELYSVNSTAHVRATMQEH